MTEPVFSGQNRVVVDWDGTCVPETWPEQPSMWQEAVEALGEFLDAGLEVMIFSTRLAPRKVDERAHVHTEDWLREYHYIRAALDDEGLEQVGIWTKPWKPGGIAYIDDKGVRYTGNWDDVVSVVLGNAGGDPQ